MAIVQLEKAAWHTYLDQVSKTLSGKSAEIEIDALPAGAQIEAEWLPLFGLVYDPHSDIIAIICEGLDHMIRQPQALNVDQDMLGLRSLEVIDADQIRHIVKLREPLMLPAPVSAV